MEKIVYTKYSTERADEFKIVTSIFSNTNGKKRVEKRARHKKARFHIESLKQKYVQLKTYYKETSMEVVPCEVCGSTAIFPYVEGESLECILDQYVDNRDVEGFAAAIGNYKKIITEQIEMIPFQVCDDFIRVFGGEHPQTGVEAYKISNIDLIFSNIIVDDGNWNIIDYEWVFDFPVPVSYVVYRAVKTYIEMSAKRGWLLDCDIYRILGFTQSDRNLYDSMDLYFQKFVAGDAVILDTLYQNMSTKAVNLSDIIVKNLDEEYRNEIQVFYDHGDGYSEENSYKIYPSFGQPVAFEIELDESMKSVRFDPGREFCIVKIVNVTGVGKVFYDLSILSNGVEIGNRYFIFLTKDPQFYIQNWEKDIHKIRIEAVIGVMKNQIAADLIGLIGDYKNKLNGLEANIYELKDKIHELELTKNILLNKIAYHEQMIMEQETTIEEQSNSINEWKKKAEEAEQKYLMIENSHFWRMTKPARVIVSKLKMLRVIQRISGKKNKC